MSQHLVEIARYRDLPSAGLAQSTLEAAGIRCFLDDQYTIGVNWLYSNALGGIKLRVVSSDAEKARELLQIRGGGSQADAGPEEGPLPQSTCPECGSTAIKGVNYQRRFAALSLLLAFPLFFFGKRYRCEKCGHKWK